ncbi:hypothetical protein SAY86_026094 [Trapa natans]|uniref:Alliinase n=1 Tax=Trapa natans TaxID=22666 RepID=A0AAN7QEE7_TRANT|nr:hypothetical protein SAY86_026094 [Trapa natans]
MVKTAGTLKLALLVASCSIASNLSFVMELNLGMGLRASSEQDNDGWTRRAAEEAEAVASTDCSGHGRAYLDGFLVHGKAACECNMCYGGHDCSEFSPDCPANADSGDPLFLEPYWREHAASSAVLVPGWHRMGYSYTGETLISEALEGQVRKLHAVVGNADTVYERMANHLLLNTIGVSGDSQLRSLKLLKVVLEDGGRGIFEFGYGKMKSRWQRLRSTVSLSNRFTLQKVPSQDCTFFQELMRESTPAYAWVKCEWEKDEDCLEVMRAANIIGRGGALFKADKRYVRLSLIGGDDDFDHLVNRLHKLISREERRG